jgi:hypothetical protein
MVWPLLIAGAGLAAAGSAANYYGAQESNRAQRRVFDEEMKAQDEEDRRAQLLLENFLAENNPGQRQEEVLQRQSDEQRELTQVAETITGGAENSARNGVDSAQGRIETAGQAVRTGAARRVAPVTRVHAYQQQAMLDDERFRDYLLDRNRIALRAQGRSRLLPARMNAAGLRGSEAKAVGAGASALGQMLLMYGISAPTTTGGSGAATVAV